jgi:hypothetical protein
MAPTATGTTAAADSDEFLLAALEMKNATICICR